MDTYLRLDQDEFAALCAYRVAARDDRPLGQLLEAGMALLLPLVANGPQRHAPLWDWRADYELGERWRLKGGMDEEGRQQPPAPVAEPRYRDYPARCAGPVVTRRYTQSDALTDAISEVRYAYPPPRRPGQGQILRRALALLTQLS